MKKQFILFSTVLLGAAYLAAVGTTASAAEITNGKIKYTTGELIINPPDITDPSVPPINPDPTDPGAPTDPNEWNLALPTNLDFGSAKLSATTQEFWAMNQFGADGHQLVVEKSNEEGPANRTKGGLTIINNSGAGWETKVTQMEQFKSKDPAADELTSAALKIKFGSVGTQEGVPKPAVSFQSGEIYSLVPGQEVTLMSGTIDNVGRSTLLLDGFQLEVPGSVMKAKEYQTTMNWVASNV